MVLFAFQDARESSSRVEKDIVFCSNNCFILYTSTAQAKTLESKVTVVRFQPMHGVQGASERDSGLRAGGAGRGRSGPGSGSTAFSPGGRRRACVSRGGTGLRCVSGVRDGVKP